MRELVDHIVPGDSANHQILIRVLDEPGAGNAHHQYEILGPAVPQSGERVAGLEGGGRPLLGVVTFQNGPIKEVGVNGTTGEANIAIEIDRLKSFQAGPYACRENAIALTHLQEALMWLQRRTVERIRRGVEGTHTV